MYSSAVFMVFRQSSHGHSPPDRYPRTITPDNPPILTPLLLSGDGHYGQLKACVLSVTFSREDIFVLMHTVFIGRLEQFSLNLVSCFSKILSTKDQFVVENCTTYFECPSVSEAVKKRKQRFLEKFPVSRNLLCELFCHI